MTASCDGWARQIVYGSAVLDDCVDSLLKLALLATHLVDSINTHPYTTLTIETIHTA
jgi:hypothetical protein